MTEQQTAHLDPIEQPKPRENKPKPYALPKATRPSPSIDPANFDRFADELKQAGGMGEQTLIEVTRALGDALNQMTVIADAEDAIINAQNEMMRAGGSAAGLTYDKGKVRAVPGQYNDLAETVEPALDKAITQIDDRLKKLAAHQVRLINEMDVALKCPETARDTHLRADIRAHMKAIGSHKAKGFAVKAAMDGDIKALQVILNSPIYLMGLDQKDVNTVRETARKTLKPDLNRAYEIGQKGQELMEIAKKGLVKKRETIATYRLADQKAASDALSKVKNLTKLV